MDSQMGLGWKVIAGAIFLGIGQLAGALVADCPVPAWVPWLKWLASGFNAAGMVVGGIGVSSKVANAVNNVTSSLNAGNQIVAKAMKEQKFVDRVIEKRVPYIVKQLGPNDEIIVKNKSVGSPEIKKE